MIDVLVTGVESSGTRLLTLALIEHPELVVLHHSMPHGIDVERHWLEFDGSSKVLIVIREQRACHASRTAHHPTDEPWTTQEAYRRLFRYASDERVQCHVVTYEGFCLAPQAVMDGICDWLGVERLPLTCAPLGEPILEANTKWYG